ncbi:protein of unknown function [Candidatus Nitrospira inopinata]|uniref:Uncharacterized protein n=1 Tax=Candidatus Nitrospira inopinata TaxID=1715989 RepID=A0A0S4KWL1_9BACT|nr:protein of unknown function [Candidatus Nitrospira inopinata]
MNFGWDSDLKKKGLRRNGENVDSACRRWMGFRPEEKGIKTIDQEQTHYKEPDGIPT